MNNVASPAHAPTCPVCACSLEEGEAPTRCPGCETPHHADCWEYNDGCAIYGCPGVALTVAPAPLPTAPAFADDRRFVFDAGGLHGRMERLELRLLGTAVGTVVTLLVFYLAGPLGGSAVLFAGLVLAAMVRDRVRFDARHGQVVHTVGVGPYQFHPSSIPFSHIDSVSVGAAYAEEGLEHRAVLRAVLKLKTGQTTCVTLDTRARGIGDDDVERWALALRSTGQVQVLKAPPARRRVLLKRVRAFQAYLDSARPLSIRSERLWRLRWVLYPGLCALVGLLLTILSGFRHPEAFVGLCMVGLAYTGALGALTAFFTFFRLDSILAAVVGTRSTPVNPYPQSLTPGSASENLEKIQGFLALVEGKQFLRLLPPRHEEFLASLPGRFLTVQAVSLFVIFLAGLCEFAKFNILSGSLVVLGLLGVLGTLVAQALVGALLLGDRWNEEWVEGWLASSRAVLESNDPVDETGRYILPAERPQDEHVLSK